MRSQILVEIITPSLTIVRRTVRLCDYRLERDTWDPGRGEIELDLDIDELASAEASTFIVDDQTIPGQELADRWASVEGRIGRREAVRVRQKRPWRCSCGAQVATVFCGRCGHRGLLDVDTSCSSGAHVRLDGGYCPSCGVSAQRPSRPRGDRFAPLGSCE